MTFQMDFFYMKKPMHGEWRITGDDPEFVIVDTYNPANGERGPTLVFKRVKGDA